MCIEARRDFRGKKISVCRGGSGQDGTNDECSPLFAPLMSLIELEIRPKRRLEPELRSGRSNLRSMKVSSVMEIVRIVIGITCTASFRISRIAIFKGSISGKFNYQGLHVVPLSLTQKVGGGVWGPFFHYLLVATSALFRNRNRTWKTRKIIMG